MTPRTRIRALFVVLAALVVVVLVWAAAEWLPGGGTPATRPSAAPEAARAALGSVPAVAATSPTSRQELPASAPSAPPSGSLRVVVVFEPDAAPGVGVSVECTPLDGNDATFATRGAATDAAGVAVFADVPAGPVRVGCDRGAESEGTVAPAGVTQLTLRIPAGRELRGIVVDPAGQAVPGAEIWAYPRDYRFYGEQGRAVTQADGAGRFALRGLWVRNDSGIGARARGFAPSPIVLSAPADREVVLRFEGPAALLRVRVVDAQARPVARARVHQRPARVNEPHVDGVQLSPRPSTEAYSDAGGEALLENVTPGRCEVAVRARGFAPRSEFLELAPHAVTEVTVTLQPGATLWGTVRDAAGAPIARASVASDGGGHVWTGPGGGYRLEGIPLGDFGVSASARGYSPAQARIPVREPVEVEWSPVLEPRAAIRGRFVDAAGQPLAGAQARVIATTGKQTFHSSVSDREGRFTVQVVPGLGYRLFAMEATSRFYVACEGPDLVPGGEERVFTIGDHQRANAHLTGIVVGEDGAPVRDLVFSLHTSHARSPIGGTIDPATGRFRIGPVPPQTYRLRVRGRDNAPPEFDAGEFTLTPNATFDAGTIGVPVLGSLRYRVRVVGDVRYAAVRMEATRAEDGDTDMVSLQVQGGELPMLPGTYRAVLHGDGFAFFSTRFSIQPRAATTIDVVLRAATRRTLSFHKPAAETSMLVVVRDADGTVVYEEDLDAEDDEPWPRRRWWPLPQGRLVVEATGGSGRKYGCAVVVESLAPSKDVLEVRPQ